MDCPKKKCSGTLEFIESVESRPFSKKFRKITAYCDSCDFSRTRKREITKEEYSTELKKNKYKK